MNNGLLGVIRAKITRATTVDLSRDANIVSFTPHSLTASGQTDPTASLDTAFSALTYRITLGSQVTPTSLTSAPTVPLLNPFATRNLIPCIALDTSGRCLHDGAAQRT